MSSKVQPAPGTEVSRLNLLGRDLASATLMFHAHIAARLGLSINDHKCLDLISRERGRLTAGDLAAAAGLSSGTATGVVDRLVRAGYVRRVRDSRDRRKIFLRPVSTQQVAELFEGLSRRVEMSAQQFTSAELRVIESWVIEMIDVLRAETVELQNRGPE